VATAPLDTEFVQVLVGQSTLHVSGAHLRLSSDRGVLVFAR
jgi:hypothetical protein